jgi:hypothetical protein
VRGYYEADELGENIFEFPKWQKFLLDPDFEDIGIAEVQGQINGCPTQIIVQHLAGYVPPHYTAEEISSWRNGLDSLKKVQSGWLDLKTNPDSQQFYSSHQTDIDHLNQIIAQRIQHLEAIVSKMNSNQWLTKVEKNYIDQEKSLSKEQNELAKKLNENQ